MQPEPIGKVPPRAIARVRLRSQLPPLDPDGYLAWLWKACGGRGRPMRARDWWLAFQRPAGLTEAEGRKAIVSMAAHSRRRVRLERMAAKNGSALTIGGR